MMTAANVPKELFVVEDANGVPQRNYKTGTMFYTRQGHAQKKTPVGGSVICYELTRKGAVDGRIS
jgi:hypothetical protein